MRSGFIRLSMLAALLLAGCGVDGPPERPSTPGLTISGEARVGVKVGG